MASQQVSVVKTLLNVVDDALWKSEGDKVGVDRLVNFCCELDIGVARVLDAVATALVAQGGTRDAVIEHSN